ncbi:hypothetical protein L1D15_18255 [Vibrio sp. Isolate25]|uniref:hypothetical protein n=1 Tax=Vibrio TaxID=662 RepID=UPI001EFEDFAA|nr:MULTISPECIES: hypothetical protein [Vibrio]MBE3681827.1 hypothetical protein [Vibrio parahaemolyticus]MCG9598658.1 hypothetical protein [Vibrio sp. Isolate25]WOO27797.1 hypothetical protein R1T29_00680 [Vibrio parahaemolyticus]HBH7908815.1 hypothetical protein [Vibrio parahaemolyticus]
MNLRESIFCHEMFLASNVSSSCSYGSSHIRQIEETWDFEDDEFYDEIKSLEMEGLIRKDGDHECFQATKQGLIAREKSYQERGLRHPALQSQTDSISDMIIALMSSNERIGIEALEYTEFDLDAVNIYLWKLSEKEIDSAVKYLLDNQFIEKEAFGFYDGNYHHLTAKGRRYYAKTVTGLLNISPPRTILSAVPDCIEPPAFTGDYAENLVYRWNEAEKCRDAAAWLSATTMYGSILETVLISVLQAREEDAYASSHSPKRRTPIERWRLDDMLKVANCIGIIDNTLAGYGNVLRDARNLIHPSKQIKEASYPDKESAKIAAEVVRAIVAKTTQLYV